MMSSRSSRFSITPFSIGCAKPTAKIGLYFPTEMKLRDHPLLQQCWPPRWLPFYGPRVLLTGEVGILEDIRHSTVSEKRCILLMEHDETRYIAEMAFDDEPFCRRFVKLVEPHCGKPIAKIGDLDIC
jgi:hypothetical protein